MSSRLAMGLPDRVQLFTLPALSSLKVTPGGGFSFLFLFASKKKIKSVVVGSIPAVSSFSFGVEEKSRSVVVGSIPAGHPVHVKQ